MAINNQTAVLKVVDNLVYFSVEVTPGVTTGNTTSLPVINTKPTLVPVGFVMNVTPQIAENDIVVLNVRPTITSRIAEVIDPNPNLNQTIQNRIPVIRSREFESVLSVPSGRTAIIGGLMEDSFDGSRSGLPILSRIPIFGDAVSFRNDTALKRELIIFLRPVVIRDASLEGDLAAYRRYLPDHEFFRDTQPPLPAVEQNLQRMERGEFPDLRGTRNPVVPDPPPPGARP
jgi:general secretion pathway protein D